jgi:hypothetical protein
VVKPPRKIDVALRLTLAPGQPRLGSAAECRAAPTTMRHQDITRLSWRYVTRPLRGVHIMAQSEARHKGTEATAVLSCLLQTLAEAGAVTYSLSLSTRIDDVGSESSQVEAGRHATLRKRAALAWPASDVKACSAHSRSATMCVNWRHFRQDGTYHGQRQGARRHRPLDGGGVIDALAYARDAGTEGLVECAEGGARPPSQPARPPL